MEKFIIYVFVYIAMEITILGQKFRGEIIILCMIVTAFIIGNMWCSCSGGLLEGFESGIKVTGAAIDYSMGKGVPNSWEKKAGAGEDSDSTDWSKHLESNVGGKVPLDEGELLIFAKNKFDSSCCPSTYTNSMGCVCVTPEQQA